MIILNAAKNLFRPHEVIDDHMEPVLPKAKERPIPNGRPQGGAPTGGRCGQEILRCAQDDRYGAQDDERMSKAATSCP